MRASGGQKHEQRHGKDPAAALLRVGKVHRYPPKCFVELEGLLTKYAKLLGK
jgi:hypothetical protein